MGETSGEFIEMPDEVLQSLGKLLESLGGVDTDGSYAAALDSAKRKIASATSNKNPSSPEVLGHIQSAADDLDGATRYDGTEIDNKFIEASSELKEFRTAAAQKAGETPDESRMVEAKILEPGKKRPAKGWEYLADDGRKFLAWPMKGRDRGFTVALSGDSSFEDGVFQPQVSTAYVWDAETVEGAVEAGSITLARMAADAEKRLQEEAERAAAETAKVERDKLNAPAIEALGSDPKYRNSNAGWAAGSLGLRRDDIDPEFAESFRDVVRNGDVKVAVTADALESILSDGRMKNFFETGESLVGAGTSDYANLRRWLEDTQLGVDPDSDPGNRPIYGYVDSPEIQKLTTETANWLSRTPVRLTLKPDVKSRSTATVGDSLNNVGQGIKMSDIGTATDKDIAHSWGSRSVNKFVEAQIQGGVSIDDIAVFEIVLPEDPEQAGRLRALADRLKERGIDVRVS